jgi:hypothetical protein
MMKDERMYACIVWMNVKKVVKVKRSGIMPPTFQENPQIPEVCQSANYKSAHFLWLILSANYQKDWVRKSQIREVPTFEEGPQI